MNTISADVMSNMLIKGVAKQLILNYTAFNKLNCVSLSNAKISESGILI